MFHLKKIAFVGAVFVSSFSCASKKSEFLPKYERKHWAFPADLDKNCFNSRHEILKEQSLVPVTVKKCKVTAGQWNDFYFPEVLNSPKDVDIDHVVPLKHAHDHGAHSWTRAQKKSFANDPINLVITHRKYNRTKGSKDLTEWLPSKKEYACKYYKRWIEIKMKYSLLIKEEEREQGKLLSCDSK